MKHYKHWISALTTLGIFLPSITSAADLSIAATAGHSQSCRLQVSNHTPYSNARYDPLSSLDYSQKLAFRVRNVGKVDCQGRLRFVSTRGEGSLRNGDGGYINFALFDKSRGGRLIYDSQTDRYAEIPLDLRAGRTVFLEPRIFVSRAQKGASGNYISDLDVAFLPGTFGYPSDYFDAGLNLTVKPSVQANFTGVDRSTRNGNWSLISLDELTPGKRRRFGLQIRSNTDVDAEISSLNGGKLGHIGRPQDAIDYTLKIAGRDLDLSGQQSVFLPAAVDRDGQTSPVEIELENFTNKPAGFYGDVIRVRISAR
jgi:hypothetical protein